MFANIWCPLAFSHAIQGRGGASFANDGKPPNKKQCLPEFLQFKFMYIYTYVIWPVVDLHGLHALEDLHGVYLHVHWPAFETIVVLKGHIMGCWLNFCKWLTDFWPNPHGPFLQSEKVTWSHKRWKLFHSFFCPGNALKKWLGRQTSLQWLPEFVWSYRVPFWKWLITHPLWGLRHKADWDTTCHIFDSSPSV